MNNEYSSLPSEGENLTPLKVLLDELLKDFYCSDDFMSPER
jgi:hypothetical protein